MKLFKLTRQSIIFITVLIAGVLLYVNRDRLQKANILRKAYKDEFDNFDIQAHKQYITGGSYQAEQADAGTDFVPKKTSKFVAYCQEGIEECMQY